FFFQAEDGIRDKLVTGVQTCALPIFSQMNFVRNADLGFNKEALFIMNANTDSVVHAREEAFKQKLLQIPGVRSVSFSTDVPSSRSEERRVGKECRWWLVSYE